MEQSQREVCWFYSENRIAHIGQRLDAACRIVAGYGFHGTTVERVTCDAQSVLEKEIRPDLSQIDIPTLLIWGPYDAEVPLEVGRQLDRDMPSSDITIVLGSGHYVQEELSDQVRAAI